MTVLHFDALAGKLTSALPAADTSMSSAGLAALGTVAGPDIVQVTLYRVDSLGRFTWELVHVTAHTAAATTATVLRNQGGTNQTWPAGTKWTHAFTVRDRNDLVALVTAEAALARNADNLTSGTIPDARIPAAIARDSEVATAVSDHAALADPHPGYLTPAEGNATYAQINGTPRIVVKESPTDVRHPDFGGVDLTGATSAVSAIQAAIDFITGAADPATNTRQAGSPIYLPKGTYRIDQPLVAKSVIGFGLHGDGKEQTVLKPVGTLSSVLDLNGVSRSTVGGFSINGDGTEQVTDCIIARHNAANRTTNYSTIEKVAIGAATRCVIGIRIGEDGDNTQVDTFKLDDLDLIGSWESGDTTWWQRGLSIGGGAAGNNLDHHGYDINLGHFRRNLFLDADQFCLFGCEFGSAEADIYIGTLVSYLLVMGGRSESSERFVEQVASSSAPATAFFADIDWRANELHADGRFIKWQAGGHLGLRNIRAYASTIPSATPRLYTATATRKLDVTIDGIQARATLKDFLTDVGVDTQVHLRGGYSEIGAGGAIVTHTPGTVDVAGTVTDIVGRSRLKGDNFDRWQRQVDGVTLAGDGTSAPTAAGSAIGIETAARVAADKAVPISTQAGTTYTLVLADAGTEIEFTAATAVAVSVPANAAVAFPTGTIINLRQYGAGQVTVTGAVPPTLRAPNGAKTAAQYSTLSIVKRGTDEWIVSGDATA